MIVALIALCVSLGTSAWAAVRVTSREIVDGSIKTIDIRNSEVTTQDIRNGTITRGDLASTARYDPGTWTKVVDVGGADFGAGWSDYSSLYQEASYRKDSNGYVYLRGAISNSGGNVAMSTALTFPAGYRPAKYETFSVTSTNGVGGMNSTDSLVEIGPDGSLMSYDETDDRYVSLDGISFLAAT